MLITPTLEKLQTLNLSGMVRALTEQLEHECFLGAHSTILSGISVGRCSKVSAGSVVTRDSEEGSLLVGNPAKGRVMYSVK